jgi:phospholipase D1/2
MDFIRFYHLRSYDRINAPSASYLGAIEQRSGITFVEAQVALARQWVGQDMSSADAPKEVIMKDVSPTDEALVVSEKSKTNTKRVPIPQSEEAARGIIATFENTARQIRGDDDVSDSVAQHMLFDRTGLESEKWLGTEREELDSYISELLYINTKLMIVDDRRVIMGSANINDRSQKGDGDSEIALVVEDTDMIESYMNGRPYNVSMFAATLRRQLFREHLGLIPPQQCSGPAQPTSFMRPVPYPNEYDLGSEPDRMVADPLSDYSINLWNETARKNREIFTEIFRPVPTNLVRDWNAYANYVPKVKPGHVAPGVPLARVKERLSLVRGALVECPLDFLIDDKAFVEGPDWKGLNPTLPIYI